MQFASQLLPAQRRNFFEGAWRYFAIRGNNSHCFHRRKNGISQGADNRKRAACAQGFHRLYYQAETNAIRSFNDDEVLAFAGLTFNKPFQVRFIELMPLGQAKLDYGEDYIPAAQLIEKISESFELEQIKNEKNKTDGPAKIYKINGGRG